MFYISDRSINQLITQPTKFFVSIKDFYKRRKDYFKSNQRRIYQDDTVMKSITPKERE